MKLALATVAAVTLLLAGSTAIATAASHVFNSGAPADRTLVVRENNLPILTKDYHRGLWTTTVTIHGNYEILPSRPNQPSTANGAGLRVRVYFNSPGEHSIDVNSNALSH